MVEAVFCDLDGTLLRGGSVETSDLLSLSRMRRRGSRLVLVTGRPSRAMGDVPARLLSMFDAIYCCNGAEALEDSGWASIASHTGGLMYGFLGGASVSLPDVAFGFEFGSRFVYEERFRFWPSGEGRSVNHWSMVIGPAGSPSGLFKVLCRAPGMSAGELSTKIKSVADDFEVSFSCSPDDIGPVELAPPGVNKGSVVRRECERFGFGPASCVAFGNANNDLAMLANVGTGVLVGDYRADVLGIESTTSSVGEWLDEAFKED